MPVNNAGNAGIYDNRLALMTPWEQQDRARAAAVDRQDQWPYPWSYVPPGGRPFNARGSVQVPSFGTQVLVAEYEVPPGYMGVLHYVFWQYVGTGFIEGSGDITTTIDVNTPLNVSALDGYTLPGFADMTFSIGNNQFPWPLAGGWVLDEAQTVRIKATPNATVTTGAGSYFLAGLVGWIWPAQTNR